MLDWPVTTCMEIVHLDVPGDVFDGVLFCAVLFPHLMSFFIIEAEVGIV